MSQTWGEDLVKGEERDFVVKLQGQSKTRGSFIYFISSLNSPSERTGGRAWDVAENRQSWVV